MKITDSSGFRNLLRDLEIIQERMQKAQSKVSSGKNVNRPSDNPSAASDIIRLNGEKAEIDQYLRNASFAKSKLEFTDTVLDSVERMIERIRSLGYASLGSSAPKEAYTSEIAGLRDQIFSTANTAFQGRSIFGGTVTDAPAYEMKADGTVIYKGNGSPMKLQVGRSSTIDTQIAGSEIFTGSVDIFATLQGLVDRMKADDTTGVRAQLAKIEALSGVVATSRSRIGGYINVADSTEKELNAYRLARDTNLSAVQSADLAQAITEFTLTENALRAATAIGARISRMSLIDFLT